MTSECGTLDMRKVKIYTVLAILICTALGFWAFKDWLPAPRENNVSYKITKRWNLPEELREVSGIVWLDNHLMAAIQDEDGIIFIYNLETKLIENQIEFGENGDYEGLTIKNDDAYVVTSDGVITEIKNFKKPNFQVSTYKTPFSEKNNIESLEIDPTNNRLLLAPKDHDLGSEEGKGIYSYSLETHELNRQPVFTIAMNDPVLKRFRDNKKHKTFRPSDMAIHPITGEYYVLEGVRPKLLIIDRDGHLKNAYFLEKAMFPQPEGITFNEEGILFISSEGKGDGLGIITQLQLNDRD
ncbi:hypothetical protein D1013_17695 [Euzebyella marina]|uniref:SdiA-regulated family protein n=1 Tax=Euzebyella marina TaxID=1761453 RepID=A0A3G2LA50_9FLAO|nr:SdiA-regulated domain-containing protein [Euzebyella marina]AYN69081.1 hypothetical protein D1013_17695 [Euzebyella marina]